MNYLYSYKLRNHSIAKSAKNYEQLACLVISANNWQQAVEWGDSLIQSYCRRNPAVQKLTSRTSQQLDSIPDTLTLLNYGESVGDELLAW